MTPDHSPQVSAEAHGVIVDFLCSWRFCPVSEQTSPSRCLEDAAAQLLDALLPHLRTEQGELSDRCSCGKWRVEHEQPWNPPKDDCRYLTWKEVAEHNGQVANERRKEGREAHLRAERLEAEQGEEERLESERDEWRERCEIVDQARGNDAVLIARLEAEQGEAERLREALEALQHYLRLKPGETHQNLGDACGVDTCILL